MTAPVRGRRPGGPDTRGAILEAARESFAAHGFPGTTIRGVAADAGVDPALVHHYFGSKDDLFLAALDLAADPRVLVPTIFADGVELAGERLVRLVLSIWDDPALRLPLLAMVRSGLGGEPASSLLRDGIFRMVLTPLRDRLRDPLGARLGPGEAEVRTQMVASQLLGLVVGRYLLELEPLASMPAEEIAGWLGPTVQRYLSGQLPA